MKERTLSPEEIERVIECFKEYCDTCLANGKHISAESVENSLLLRRLLSGKPRLDWPPPTRFGMPAYELVENAEVEIERIVESGGKVSIDDDDGYVRSECRSLLLYPRLGLKFELVEREVMPDEQCLGEESDPKEYKYNVRVLKRAL
jgi:hypothetical protein